MNYRLTVMTVGLFLSLLALGCQSKSDTPEPGQAVKAVEKSGPLNVVSTVGMITDLVRIIGGESVTATGLMGPGTDPHQYKARESDIRALAKADLVFYNGLHLEGKLGDVLHRLAKKKTVIAVSDRIEPAKLRETSASAGTHDPHIWFDVRLWMLAADRIRDGLSAAAPSRKAQFDANTEKLLADLRDLHQWVLQIIDTIPKERRVLITAHDAFGYFGDAYGIEVRGIQGISTEDEAGVKDINNLIDFIATRGIKAVFVESSVPKKNIEALVEGSKAKGHDLRIGGELFSDAMGAAGAPEGTYIGMVRHNVTTIVQALK